MASRQRRARMRAALSIALARSQSGIAPRERLGTFTIKRPWHGVLIVLACLSGHADAKLWYYNPYPWVAEYGKLYSSIDEYCAAMAQPGQKFIYSPVVGGCYFFDRLTENDPEEWSSIQVRIIECEDPNSTPKVEAWIEPSCPCNAGYKRESERCVAYSPPETPADRKCDAGLFSGNPNTTRTWRWTWNAQGLAATETAPNGAVTSYEYDSRGNLVRSINALGHIARYGYDFANRVTSTTAANGLVTTYTWDARNRLLARKVGGQQTTALTYTATGLVETLKLPTGLSFTYSYDAAHRLTGWSNSRGESGSYTLDAMGNRTAEQVRNSTGALAWTAVRSINNLNRLAARTDGPNQTHTFAYDANGELVADTNGLNESTRYGLDPLRRVKAITNAANATATLAYNTLDAVTRASDFKGVATNYNRDAQGNATAETSPDIGSKSIQYDALGLPSQIVDALGQATQIQRDVLGRPTLITFADGKTTTLRYDLTPASQGYLSEIVDRSGTTTYKRSGSGRTVPSGTRSRPLPRIGLPILSSRRTRIRVVSQMSSTTLGSWACTETRRAGLPRTGIGTSTSAWDGTRSLIASGLMADRTGIPMPT